MVDTSEFLGNLLRHTVFYQERELSTHTFLCFVHLILFVRRTLSHMLKVLEHKLQGITEELQNKAVQMDSLMVQRICVFVCWGGGVNLVKGDSCPKYVE